MLRVIVTFLLFVGATSQGNSYWQWDIKEEKNFVSLPMKDNIGKNVTYNISFENLLIVMYQQCDQGKHIFAKLHYPIKRQDNETQTIVNIILNKHGYIIQKINTQFESFSIDSEFQWALEFNYSQRKVTLKNINISSSFIFIAQTNEQFSYYSGFSVIFNRLLLATLLILFYRGIGGQIANKKSFYLEFQPNDFFMLQFYRIQIAYCAYPNFILAITLFNFAWKFAFSAKKELRFQMIVPLIMLLSNKYLITYQLIAILVVVGHFLKVLKLFASWNNLDNHLKDSIYNMLFQTFLTMELCTKLQLLTVSANRLYLRLNCHSPFLFYLASFLLETYIFLIRYAGGTTIAVRITKYHILLALDVIFDNPREQPSNLCPICFSSNYSKDAVLGRCGHCFHQDCIRVLDKIKEAYDLQHHLSQYVELVLSSKRS